MERFSEEVLAHAVQALSPKARLAFALSCGERLFPNYVAFLRENAWGNAAPLRAALDTGWEMLDDRTVSLADRRALMERVEAEAPNTEDFDTILVSSALDAATAASLVLRLLDDGSPSTVVAIAALCRDTVDMFVQDREALEPSQSDFEERIGNHPLMQRELQRQATDINELSEFGGTTMEVERIRQKWRSPARSNIDQIA